jgi:hypothetical protein
MIYRALHKNKRLERKRPRLQTSGERRKESGILSKYRLFSVFQTLCNRDGCALVASFFLIFVQS